MQNAEPIKSWYKQFWPWFIILLPASVVVAGIVTVIIAFKHEDSLVNSDYYKDGLAINQKLELEKNAKNLHIAARLTLDQFTGEVRVVVSGEFEQTPKTLRLLFSHPLNKQQDILLSMKHTPNNDYLAQLNNSISGRWYIQLSDHELVKWRLSTEINLQHESHIDFGHLRPL